MSTNGGGDNFDDLINWDMESPSVLRTGESTPVSSMVLRQTGNEVSAGVRRNMLRLRDSSTVRDLEGEATLGEGEASSRGNSGLIPGSFPSRPKESGMPLAEAESHDSQVDDSDEDGDFEAIQRSCRYVTSIVGNFNTRKDTLSAKAKVLVDTMNRDLNNMVKKEPNYDCDIEPNVPPVPCNEDEEVTGPKRVRFGKTVCPPDGSHSHHSGKSTGYSIPRMERQEPPLDLSEVLRALSRFDNRTVPKPEEYDLQSGQDLAHFIERFEEYCRYNFKGCSDLWIGELRRLLRGEMLEVFDALRTPSDSYQALRDKLLSWRKAQQEIIEKDAKRRFSAATMRPDESPSLYAARLAKLYHVAYPNRTTENSASLRQKYFESVPPAFRNHLLTTRSIRRTFGDEELSWSAILNIARMYEVDAKVQNTSVQDEIYVSYTPSNPPMPRSRYDAWTRHDQYHGNEGPDVRQKRDGRTYQRSRTRDSSRSRVICHHCQISGHMKKDCWRLHNLCLVCGASDHRIADCPKRIEEEGIAQQTRTSRPSFDRNYTRRERPFSNRPTSERTSSRGRDQRVENLVDNGDNNPGNC